PYSQTYINYLKTNSIYVSGEGKNELLAQIEKAAEKYNQPPQDAKIDRVWKALPGYNGIKVDVKASYDVMKKDRKYDERKLVFTQLSPKIHLLNLPPSPIFKGHPEKPMVSLLINVAWGEEYLPSMLATLKEHHVHATFFLEGRWVKKNAELAKLIADSGHEL